MATPANIAARNAYIDAQIEAATLLRAVQDALEDQQETTAPEEIHWGHVGDLRTMIAQLRALL